MKTQKFTPDEIIKAIQDNKGMVFLAAKSLKCDPGTIRNYAKRYKAVQEALELERGEMVDIAELALLRAIKAGEGWAVCFALKTLGKERGFVERQEMTGKDGGSIKFEFTWSDADDNSGHDA